VPAQYLKHFQSGVDDLLHLVFEKLDRPMLRAIAEADYGMDANDHLKALEALKSGDMPAPMGWVPKEVLDLTRWSEPDDPQNAPVQQGVSGHWIRLFACTILIRAAAEPKNEGYFLGEDSTIIQLVDSAIQLGPEPAAAALKFLCWRRENTSCGYSDDSLLAIAILILAAWLDTCDAESADYLISAIAEVDAMPSVMFDLCMKKQAWKKLSREILVESDKSTDPLRHFGKALLGM
jgi:hypothetical protein